MKKLSLLLTLFFLLTFGLSYGYTQTLALSNLINTAKFTAQNAASFPVDSRSVTVATMYGGVASWSPAPMQSVANLSYVTWTLGITNKGNASATFRAIIVNSNSWLGGGTWNRHFVGSTTLGPITPFGNSTITFVITNSVAASNYAYNSYLIKFSNTAPIATNAHVYKGSDNTTWYGGNIGVLTNDNQTNRVTAGSRIGPVVYMQFAGSTSGQTNKSGFLTARISGPVLRISKSVEAITHPSGMYTGSLTVAEPGAYITYVVRVTNVGSQAATNSKVIDTIKYWNVQYVDTVNMTNFGLQSTNGGLLSYTNLGKHLLVGAANRGLIRYRVKVK